MNRSALNNAIKRTLTKNPPKKGESSLGVARRVFASIGVPLPTGKLIDVVRTLNAGNSDWKRCSVVQAEQWAELYHPIIGISKNRVVSVIMPQAMEVNIDNKTYKLPINIYARPIGSIPYDEVRNMQFFVYAVDL